MPRDLELFEQRGEVGVAPAAIGLHHFEHRAHIVLDVETAKDRRLLRQIADSEAGPLVHRKMRDVVAVELDFAAFSLDQAGDHIERSGLARPVRPQQADRLAAPDIKAHTIDHPAAAIALLQAMSGKIALLHPLLPAGRVLLSWARPGWGRLGAVSASRRHRPTKSRQIHVLRAAVGFSCTSGRAAVPEQRKDAEHAFALEADGPQRSRPVALRNPADWNRTGRVVNPGRRLELRRCRSRAWARRPRSHLPP